MYESKARLLALQTLLVNGESILQEFLLLLEVDGLETGRDRGAGRTASVHDVAAVVVLGCVEQGLDARLDEGPGTGVQRLLLAPHDVAGVGVAVQVLAQLVPREGVQLLDTGDGRVANAVGLAVLDERGVHLARADNHALDLLRCVDGVAVGRVADDPLEVRVVAESLDVRAGNRVTQQRLREEDDQSCTD